MNTLLVAPELFTTDSGIPRMLRLYLKALCEIAGPQDQLRFVTLNDKSIEPSQLQSYSGPALSTWSASNRSKLKFIWQTLWMSRGANLVICGHVAQLPVAWLANCLRPGLRTILVAHGIEVWRPFTFWERRALTNTHRILCVSAFTRRKILEQIPLPESKLVVLPNALDPLLENQSAGLAANPESPVILSVSRLSSADRYKGIDHLIAAMPQILRTAPRTKLRIIGRGDDLPRLSNLVDDNRLGDFVEFTGFVSDKQLRQEFSQCTCFAMPSQNEGFGLVYLEAMTAGKPCLAATAGGAPEVISPQSGILVPYGDVQAIATACLKLIERKWNPAAIQACAQKFSFANFRERLAAAIPA